MQIFYLILIGLAGGILGGLGMGGGTLLIPLMVLFAGVTQHIAQSVSLIAFIPMAVVALIIHAKNKLVKFRYLLIISLPAAVTAVCASFWAKTIRSEVLSQGFGYFLIVIGAAQLIALIVKCIKERKKSANYPVESPAVSPEKEPAEYR